MNSGEYLLDALYMLEFTKNDAMGNEKPLDFSDLVAFSQATKRISKPFEFEALYRMSRQFLAGKRLGAKAGAISPLNKFNRSQNV